MKKQSKDKTKKEKIIHITKKILNNIRKEQDEYIEKIINSGCIDIDSWDENNTPMILPKAMCIAMLREAINQIDCRGTSFEKQVKKEAANIHLFL